MREDKLSVVSVKEQLYEIIRDAILTNEYKPGDIIQIDRLARGYGVSATPIRETLIRLEGSGLLTLIPNKGALVTEFTEKDVKDTWEMRKLLEPYAGRITALLDISEELDRVENMIRSIINGNDDFHFYIQTDNDMHELLFFHLQNNLLKETIQRIHDLSKRMRYFAESIAKNHSYVVREVCAEHLQIIEALRESDPDAAEKTILEHVTNSEKRTLYSTKDALRRVDE